MANEETKTDKYKTWSSIHLYYGVEAMGIKKEGFRQPAIYKGRINWQALKMLEEHPNDYVVVPYLKPLDAILTDGSLNELLKRVAVDYHKQRGFAHTDAEYENATDIIRAYAIQAIRSQGYDVDDLLNQDMAILHPDYDVKDLL